MGPISCTITPSPLPRDRGGVSADSRSWCPARNGFLFPLKALAKLVRGKLRAMLRCRRPDLVLPWSAWRKPWIVHITPWGEGEQAILDYLARYVFRVAITNTRITGLDDHTVTIRYKQRKSSRWRTCQIAGDEFIRRFLQHVLPKGFHKIRYFGSWHPCNRDLAARAHLLLLLDPTRPTRNRSRAPTSHQPQRSRGPHQAPISRTAGLPALSTRPSDRHSPAHAEKPDGTVTHPFQPRCDSHQPRVRRMPQPLFAPPSPTVRSGHSHPQPRCHTRFSPHPNPAPGTATCPGLPRYRNIGRLPTG